MTDKQIIIDGVDVHWCEHYTGNIGYLTDKNWTCRAKIQGTKCEDWSNCYFKRWQRKEQECETLASQLDFEVQKKECLEQECEELKEKCKKYGEINEQETKDYAQLKAENEELKKEYWKLEQGNDFLAEKNSKLKGCLTEIKEIAEKAKKDICNNCGWRNTDSCDSTDYTCGEFIKILSKISECEGNNE